METPDQDLQVIEWYKQEVERLKWIVNEMMAKAAAVTNAHEANDGLMDDPLGRDTVDQLRKIVLDTWLERKGS